MKKAVLRLVAEIVILALVNFILIRWMADQQIAARLLSPGDHLPFWIPALCGLFLGVRILFYVLLPGMIVYRLGMAAFACNPLKKRTS